MQSKVKFSTPQLKPKPDSELAPIPSYPLTVISESSICCKGPFSYNRQHSYSMCSEPVLCGSRRTKNFRKRPLHEAVFRSTYRALYPKVLILFHF